MKEITVQLKKEDVFLIVLSVVGIYFCYLVYHTPLLGQDEDIYTRQAMEFPNLKLYDPGGRPLVVPILLPIVISPFFKVFGFSLGIAKVINCLFGLGAVFITYLIGKRISTIVGILSACFLLAVPMFIHSVFWVYTECIITFFSALITYLFLRLNNTRDYIILGIVLGLSTYAKFTGIVFIAATMLYSLYKRDKFLLVSCIIGIVIMIPWIVRNIIVYNYPFVEGLNLFFKYHEFPWLNEVYENLLKFMDYTELGSIPIILIFTGISYIMLKGIDSKPVFFSVFFVAVFITVAIGRMIIGQLTNRVIPIELRHFIIMLPQLAIIGTKWINDLHIQLRPVGKAIIVFLILFSLYSGITRGIDISHQRAHPPQFENVLFWIRDNTPNDSIIFTPVGGSVTVYAQRNNFWQFPEFPEVMNTDNSTFIYEKLKERGTDYILLAEGMVQRNYTIPNAQMIGYFSRSFVNLISKDTEHFKLVKQVEDIRVFEVL